MEEQEKTEKCGGGYSFLISDDEDVTPDRIRVYKDGKRLTDDEIRADEQLCGYLVGYCVGYRAGMERERRMADSLRRFL